jgi:hypothetical protein
MTETGLQDICKVERSILESMNCFDSSKMSSILPKIFDMNTCNYLSDYSYAQQVLSRPENSMYVQDRGTGGANGLSSGGVLLSYTRMGSCKYEYRTVTAMDDAIRRANQGGIVVTYIARSFLGKEFTGATFNAVITTAEVLYQHCYARTILQHAYAYLS